MGRNIKPTQLKLLQGTDRADRRNPHEPKPNPAKPIPPEHLSDYARQEWEYITPILYDMGLLSTADKSALAGYCTAYGRWRLAEEQVNKTSLVIKTNAGNIIQNPLVGIANKALENMRKYLGLFGLSPADRSRVSAASKPEAENKWSKFK